MALAPFNYTEHLVVACKSCGATAVCQIRGVAQGQPWQVPTLPAGWSQYIDQEGWGQLLCPKHRAIVDIIDVRNL